MILQKEQLKNKKLNSNTMINRINVIIDELTDSKVNLGNVFLKVQVLAHQLKNAKLKEWVYNESNGYKSSADVPVYRIIPSIVIGNIMQGFAKYTNLQLSIHGIKDKYKVDLNEIRLRNSVSSLENMLGKEDDFSIPVPTGLYNAISKNYGPYYTSIISAKQVVSLNSVEGVISSIKSNLLQFMLEIADELGEGENIDIIKKENVIDALFEKHLGGGNTFNIIAGSNNVQAVSSGDNNQTLIAKGDNITQTLENDDIEIIKEFLSNLKMDLVDVKANVDDLEDLKTQIKVVEDQLQREKPKFSILKNTFDILKGVIAGLGTHILTESTIIKLDQIGMIFGL